MSARALSIALMTSLIIGCGDQAPPATTSYRDSAGIEIAETPIQVLPTRPQWSVAWPPVVDLSSGLDPSRAFYQVHAGAFLSTGGLVLANSGTSEVLVFDADGGLQHVLGRPGAGPGEFTELVDVDVLPGDLIVALDGRLHRLTIFSPDGIVSRTVPLDWPGPGNPRELLLLPGGRFAVFLRWSSSLVGGGEAPVGRSRLPQPVHVFHEDGRFLRTAATPPGIEFHSPEPHHWVLPLLPRVPVVGVSGGDLVVGPGETYELQVNSLSEGLTRIIRLTGGGAVTSSLTDSMKRLRLALQPTEEAREYAQAAFDELPVPETVPPFTYMLVDDEDRLWVSDFAWYGRTPREWTVFDAAGTVAARVHVPEQVRLLDVQSDRVLGVRLDELDVEHPVVLSIRPLG